MKSEAEEDAVKVAKALLSLAETAGMPDTFLESDRRTQLARRIIKKYAPRSPKGKG